MSGDLTLRVREDLDGHMFGTQARTGVVLSFPFTSVLDNFNRTEGPPPSSNWSVISAISSNNGMIAVNPNLETDNIGDNYIYWNTSTFGPNSEVYTTLVDAGSGAEFSELFLRLNNPTSAGSITGYLLYIVAASNEIGVYRIDNGPTNNLLGTAIAQTISDGDSVGATAIGGTITVYYKVGAGAWTAIGTRDGSAYTGAGYIGVGMQASTAGNVKLDNFGGGTI